MEKKSETPPPLPPVKRTAEGIRDALFDELNLLRAGKVSTSHARAVSNLARNIIEAAKLELVHIAAMKSLNKKESIQLGEKK